MYLMKINFINDPTLDFYSCMEQLQERVLSICELLNLKKIAYVNPRYHIPKYFNKTYVDFSEQTTVVAEKLAIYVFGDLFYNKYMNVMQQTGSFTFNGLFLLQMKLFDKNNNEALSVNFVFTNNRFPGFMVMSFTDDFFSEQKVTNLWDHLYSQKKHLSMILFSHKIDKKIKSMLKTNAVDQGILGWRFNFNNRIFNPIFTNKAFNHLYLTKDDEYTEFGVKNNILGDELDSGAINELVVMYDAILNAQNQ